MKYWIEFKYVNLVNFVYRGRLCGVIVGFGVKLMFIILVV